MTRVPSAIRRYFLTGLLVIIPIWGTYLVLKTLLETLDGFVGDILRQYLPYYIPGLWNYRIAHFDFYDRSAHGELSGTAAGGVGRGDHGPSSHRAKRLLHDQVHGQHGFYKQGKFSARGVDRIPPERTVLPCFVTGVTEGEVQQLTNEKVLNIYVPTTPNPTSGYLLFVPESEIIPLSMSVEDGMKMIITGGMYTPAENPKNAEVLSRALSSKKKVAP